MADKTLTALKKATKGLLYPSEYDEPLTPFVWEAADNTAAQVRRLSGQSAKGAVKTIGVDDFFAELAEVEGFAELKKALSKLLTDLAVYRFGNANITIYVVGKDKEGRLAGFVTRSVET